MENTYIFRTILGNIKIIESNNFIVNIHFKNDMNTNTNDINTNTNVTDVTAVTGTFPKETPLVIQAAKQLEEYLSGARKQFDLPLNPVGTAFQKSVWHMLQAIPYGEHWSYKQVAIALGKPTAARAVGMANNKNPIAIIIPCHRVIGSNGDLVGYAGGLAIKEQLLKLEKGELEL